MVVKYARAGGGQSPKADDARGMGCQWGFSEPPPRDAPLRAVMVYVLKLPTDVIVHGPGGDLPPLGCI